MADPQKTRTKDPEKPSEGRAEVAPEVDVATDNVRKRAALAEDILEGRISGDPEKAISSIDLNKSPEEQKAAVELLEGVGVVLLIRLDKGGHKIEKKGDLASFVLSGFPSDVPLNKPAEAAGWKKYREMIGNRDAPVSKYFLGELDRMIDVANQASSGARALIGKKGKPTSDSEGKKAEGKEKNPYKKEGFVEKAKPILGKIAIVGFALAAAWGGLKLIGSLFGDTKENEGDGFLAKHKKAIAIAALTACAAGIYLERDEIKGWAAGLGVALTWGGIKKFVKDTWNGDWDLGFDFLKGHSEVPAVYKRAGDKLGVNAEALEALGSTSYARFSGEAGRLTTAGKSFIFESILPTRGIPFVHDPEKEKESIAAEKKLLELFHTHKTLLDQHDPKTVEEALAIIDQRGILGGPVVVTPGTESAGKGKKGKEDSPKPPDEVIQLNPDEEKELVDGFPAAVAPTIARVFAKEKYQGWGKVEHPFDFADDLTTAVHNDKKMLATDGEKVVLWNGYKWMTLTSARVLVNAFINVLHIRSLDDLGDTVKKYWEDDKWFIAVGAFIGGAAGAVTKTGFWKGVFTGAKEGVVAPVLVVRTHAKVIRRVGEDVGGTVRYGVKRFLSPAEAAPKLYQEEAAFWGKLFRRYHALEVSLDHGTWQSLPDAGRKIAARFLVSRQNLTQIVQRSARKFAIAYNNSKGLNSGDPDFLIIKGDEAKDYKETRKLIDETLGAEAEAAKPMPEADVVAKAAEMKAQRVGSPEGIPEFKNDQVDAMLREHGIEPGTPEADSFMEQWDKEMAERALKGKGIGDGMPEFGKMLRLESVKDLPGGGKVYRFRNMEITLTPGEAVGTPQEIYQRCFGKWREQAVKLLEIKDMRECAPGEYEYKIDGKWVKSDGPAAKPDEIKAKFLEEFGGDPRAAEIVNSGKLLKYLNPKAMPYVAKILHVVGLAGLVYMVYELETATNKREAVAKTTMGFATFLGGAWVTEKAVGKRINNPILKVAVDLMGGMLVAYGLTEPLGKIVDEYLFEKIPGSHAAAVPTISLIESLAARHGSRSAFKAMGWAAEKKLFTKVGLGSFEKLFTRKIESAALKKVAKLATKTGVRQVLKLLGWKGATLAALAADDATVIGVLDDVLAIPLALWTAKDIYDITCLVKNALALKEGMEQRNGKAITSFKIKNVEARAAIRKRLEPQLTPADKDKTIEDILATYSEEEMFTILRGEKEVYLDIHREGIAGVEQWVLKEGKTSAIKIFGEKGDLVAEVHDLDAESMEKSLEEEPAQKMAA